MTMLGKVILRKPVLAVLAGTGIIMLLVLYHSDVFITKQADQHYRKDKDGGNVKDGGTVIDSGKNNDRGTANDGGAINYRGQSRQPPWLDVVRRDGLTHNLTDVNLDLMTKNQVFLTLHSYLDNTDVVCRRKLRMGHIDDGGWEVCDDIDVRPTSPCTVYSYGINNDWSFDDDITKFYGCHAYCFDPSVAVDTHNRSSNVHFYKIGISGQRTLTKDEWQLYRHQEIRSLLKHENTPIDIIKMDVENAEWDSLEDMAATNQFEGVKQIFLEFHISKRNALFLKKLKILKLLEMYGFKRFYVHKNKNCKIKNSLFPIRRTFCYEVHYIKR